MRTLYLQFITILLTFIVLTTEVFAQGSKIGNSLAFVTKDSTFSVNFRFRMQNRAAMLTNSVSDLSTSEWEFRVRRLRLRMDGFVVNPKLTYYIQLSFSRADMDFATTDNSKYNVSPNVVRDAMIFYKPNHHFTLGFGQGKLPGNRQRVVSSGELQFADRSIVNSTFTLDRDFGFFATYEGKLGKTPVYLLKGAISSGKGRMNVVSHNTGLCYTGRVEFLPFGKFTNKGDYFEGDLEREQKPKLSLAAGYGWNTFAVRAGGQLGKDLPKPYDMLTFITDGVLKYKGWALSSEYMRRTSRNQPTIATTDNVNYVYIGNGTNTQLSYCFKNRWELAGRFAQITPTNAVWQKTPQERNYTFGLNKYLNHHRVKVQWNLSYITKKNLFTQTFADQLYTAFQIELGI